VKCLLNGLSVFGTFEQSHRTVINQESQDDVLARPETNINRSGLSLINRGPTRNKYRESVA